MADSTPSRPYNGRMIDWTGYLFYNGFRFPPQVRLRVESVPIRDSSNRTTKYIEYTFYVDFVVTDQDWITSTGGADGTGTCDTNMEKIRRRLTQTGAEFKFNGQGFGGLWVNRSRGCGTLHTQPSDSSATAPVPVVDAVMGPTPEILVCEPIGSNKVWRVSWVCKVTVPECCDSGNNPYAPWKLYELSYDQSWTIDEQGMTVRTTTATIERPGYQLSGGTAIIDMVDKYREVFFPAIPLGFLRTYTYSMDRAKRRLEILIIDREVPSDVPFWPNCLNMSVVFSVDGNPWSADWLATCSGAITLAPGVPKHYAFSAFAAIFLDRFNRGNIGNIIIPLVNENGQTTNITGASILNRVAITEDIFSRTVTFDFEWELITTLNSLFDSSGILLGLTNVAPNTASGWTLWHNSIFNNVQNNRGYAQLQNPALASVDNDDSLNGVCSSTGVQPLQPNGARAFNYYTAFRTPITSSQLPKEFSYLDYQYHISIARQNNVVQSDVVQELTSDEVSPASGQPNNNYMIDQTQTNPADLTKSAAGPSTSDQSTQIRGPGRYYLIFWGKAVRLGHRIPLPKILRVRSKAGGAVTPVLLSVAPVRSVLRKTLAGPLNGLTWYAVYQLPFVPEGDILADVEHEGILSTITPELG
jgi:hypothetical protein